jgi:hypothetical protein
VRAAALLLTVALALAAPARAGAPESESLASERSFSSAARELPGLVLDFRAAAPKPPEVCSGLDFRGAAWPDAMTADDRAAFEVALNISGSYEGSDAWVNLTNNFDGQGLSVGLLNQCLGQGSLQPMLIRLRDEHPETLEALVSPEHRRALLDMLARWQNDARLASERAPLSKLDDPGEDGGPRSVAANQASVRWAVANLYEGGDRFTPAWRSELSALASSPEYVTIQLAAAARLHDRAVADEARVGVRELRAYLFLFDVQVQNGGLYPQDLDDYAAYLRRTPRAGATERLEKLLELRLRRVRAKYRQDVRARKLAVIRGTGTVHGEARNLPAQYCYDGAWPYR